MFILFVLCNALKFYEQVIQFVIGDLVGFQRVLYHITISNVLMQLISEFVGFTEQRNTMNE